MMHSDDATYLRAYARLWVAYRASGLAQGHDPTGAAQWAYTQALQFVCPTTAEQIAAAVLATGQARAQGKAAQAINPAPNPRLAAGQQLQCATCAATAPLKTPPAGWVRVENLHREGRRSNSPVYHNFCSAACATAWFARQAPTPAPDETLAAPPTSPPTPAAPPVTPARSRTNLPVTLSAPHTTRRAVRMVRS
jgi:hypothetical protein